MAQLVTRIDDDLLIQVDTVIGWNELQNRSEFVREALVALIERKTRQRIGAEIVQGYVRVPQTDVEVGGADRAALDMILQEPW